MSIGKQFEKDLKTYFESWGCWTERFTDRMYGAGASVKSPPDLIALSSRIGGCSNPPILCEAKVICAGRDSKGRPRKLCQTSISSDRVSDHQKDHLEQFAYRSMGLGLVGVLFYTLRAKERIAALIPIQYWLGYEERFGSKSIRLDNIIKEHPLMNFMKWGGSKGGIRLYLPIDSAEELNKIVGV